MLTEFESIRDGELRCTNVSKHRIYLSKDVVRQVHSARNRLTSTTKRFAAAENNRILTEIVRELVGIEWPAPIVFVPKKDVLPSF